MSPEAMPRILVAIGLGGIYEGYGCLLPLLHLTGQLPLEILILVDGDTFEERNRARQSFPKVGPKAAVRLDQLRRLYGTELTIRAVPVYVTPQNVAALIPNGAIVLLSPDNHPTRKLVSDRAKGLDECLLIVGANDGIDPKAGTDGTEGWVLVHFRKEGKDLTAAPDVFHPEIAAGTERGPWEASCGELVAQGAGQVLQTNLLVGHWMAQMLMRYTRLPPEEATKVAEVVVNSRTGSVVRYERRPITTVEEGDLNEEPVHGDEAGRPVVPQD